jgi:hypothetical protein
MVLEGPGYSAIDAIRPTVRRAMIPSHAMRTLVRL